MTQNAYFRRQFTRIYLYLHEKYILTRCLKEISRDNVGDGSFYLFFSDFFDNTFEYYVNCASVLPSRVFYDIMPKATLSRDIAIYA